MVGQLGQAWILASPQKSLVCVCVYRGCLSNSETSWSCRLSVNYKFMAGEGARVGILGGSGAYMAGLGLLAVTISPQGAPIPDHTPEPEPDTHSSEVSGSMCFVLLFGLPILSAVAASSWLSLLLGSFCRLPPPGFLPHLHSPLSLGGQYCWSVCVCACPG